MNTGFRRSLVAASLCAPIALGCFEPSSQRAERDTEVGQASAGGATVHVDHGLAAVRHLSAGRLVLWASAPTVEGSLRVDPEPPGSWTLEGRNLMPSADLTVSADGVPTDVTLVGEPHPTRKRWQVVVPTPAKSTLRFRIATAGSDDPGPFAFGVLSDVQRAVDRVQDVFARIDEETDLAFVLTSGDLTSDGTAEQMDRFQDELRSLSIPMYGTLGNHDVFDAPTPWHGRFGRCNLHFRHRGVVFTAVDSADGTVDPLVYDWLEDWLGASKQRAHVFVTHVPMLDPVGVRGGGFASRNEAAKLLTMLAKGRVDVLFFGHIHSYYAFDNAGIPAYISGGGGAIPERFDGVGRHFLAVDVHPDDGVTNVRRVDVD